MTPNSGSIRSTEIWMKFQSSSYGTGARFKVSYSYGKKLFIF